VEYVNRWNWGRVNHDLQAEYGIDRGLSGASENWLGTKSGKQNMGQDHSGTLYIIWVMIKSHQII
jgi:hypothetical protein